MISTHAPAGGATMLAENKEDKEDKFLLTPLREGRRRVRSTGSAMLSYFYSRPCGRGDLPRARTNSTR